MVSWTLVRGLVTAAAALSAVGIIGTGIDPRAGILIQEVQQVGGEMHYLIGNVSRKDVKIRVVAFDETWRIGKPIGKVLAGPWDVRADTMVEVEADKLIDVGLVRFFLEDDTPLGVLRAPKPDPEVKRGIGGLNGQGDSVDGLYLSLPFEPLKPGESFVVRMILEEKAGAKLRFSPPRATAVGLTPHELLPEKVESKTLSVRREGDVIEIDLTAPLRSAKLHDVDLTFRVPEKNPPPMVTFSAWLANNMGGGVTVARGLAVKRDAK